MRGLRLGVAAFARPTFDFTHAEQMARAAVDALAELDAEVIGGPALLTDAASLERAIRELRGHGLDHLVVLQATFTDATSALRLARAFRVPLLLWGFPEARTGGRLRLNSLCGLNLAAHALGRAGLAYRWLYAPPEAGNALRLALQSVRPRRLRQARPAFGSLDAERAAARTAERLKTSRIGLIGRHPDGFETCRFDPAALTAMCGAEVEGIALPEVFAAADAVPTGRVEALYRAVGARLAGLAEVDEDATRRSLTVFAALERLADERRLDALAVRCWPEFFTDFGCAACGAMARLAESGTPTACEADLYGALTNLALQEIADRPVFLTDLVDLDAATDTGVLWHCGLAPLSMAGPDATPRATIHPNRRLPLLHEFALRPGRITIARLSQAANSPKLVIGGGELLDAPRPFSGTSGVVRFDRPAQDVLDVIMAEGLEHHYSIAYGDHRSALESLARRLDLPVLRLA